MTGADVIAVDKLFATLDPTTRSFTLPNKQRVLLTDTVGFLRKLPHTLIESFKATLEEVSEADLLIHIVDLSHPRVDEQMEAVRSEEHTSELQSLRHLVCRLLLEKKKKQRARLVASLTLLICI